jgi:hypothetical protein
MANDWTVHDYEVDMFRSLLDLCKTGKHKSFPHPIPNATVESLLLHTRILVDILLSRDQGSDDVKLKELLPAFDSPKIAELEQRYGNRKIEKSPCWTLNKMLAHPSSLRSDGYDYTATMNELEPLILSLLEEIQKARPQQRESSPTATTTISMHVNLSTSSKPGLS